MQDIEYLQNFIVRKIKRFKVFQKSNVFHFQKENSILWEFDAKNALDVYFASQIK